MNLEQSDNILFVFVVRNPYVWLRSFYAMPHAVSNELLNDSFLHFISNTWKHQLEGGYLPDLKYKIIDNKNPQTGKPFNNVLELRNCKNRNYLRFGQRVKNFIVVPYEKVANDPEGFIKYIATIFKVTPLEQFQDIKTYKGLNKVKYKQKTYPKISEDSILFINNNLDWEIENFLGYSEKSIERKSSLAKFLRNIERKSRILIRSFLLNKNKNLDANCSQRD